MNLLPTRRRISVPGPGLLNAVAEARQTWNPGQSGMLAWAARVMRSRDGLAERDVCVGRINAFGSSGPAPW